MVVRQFWRRGTDPQGLPLLQILNNLLNEGALAHLYVLTCSFGLWPSLPVYKISLLYVKVDWLLVFHIITSFWSGTDPEGLSQGKTHDYMVKPHGQLVLVSSTLHSAYTPSLSTSSSSTALQEDQVLREISSRRGLPA